MNTGITVSLWRRWIALLLTAVTLFGLMAPAGYAGGPTTDDSKAAAPSDALHMPAGEAAFAETACSDAEDVPEIGGISYTVEFHYAGRGYVLPGDESAALAEVLEALGITGGIEDAAVSDETLFSAARDGEDGAWLVRALRSFDTEEWLRVTVDGREHEIAVTDERSVSYLSLQGDVLTCTDFKDIQISMPNGWYVMPGGGISFSEPIQITGNDVNLILCDGASLYAARGIYIPRGNKLTIWAQSSGDQAGKIIAQGGKNCAGIGGGKNLPAGRLIVYGGDITAAGGDGAAGIGGGAGENSGYQQIRIYRGNIKATGGYHGAGIGCGEENTERGPVEIMGSVKIESRGAEGAAGIGGGYCCGCGNIMIVSGEVLAVGGMHMIKEGDRPSGAGIGGGAGVDQGGEISIAGGTITALGGLRGAGIGSGGRVDTWLGFSSIVGAAGIIRIFGGNIIARGHVGGAGIGGGYRSACGDVVISGGDVFAGFLEDDLRLDLPLQELGAGIGCGYATTSEDMLRGSVHIDGGRITAIGYSEPGIGGCGSVTIEGGDLNAQSGIAAGIGGPFHWTNNCRVEIRGGEVLAMSVCSGAGIGSGEKAANNGTVNISGGNVTALGGMKNYSWLKDYGQIITGGFQSGAFHASHGGGADGGTGVAVVNILVMLSLMIMAKSKDSQNSGTWVGAGIGGGYSSGACEVNISGGNVLAASGGSGTAPIGTGMNSTAYGRFTLGDDMNARLIDDNWVAQEPVPAEHRLIASQGVDISKGKTQYHAVLFMPCQHDGYKELGLIKDLDAFQHRVEACVNCAALQGQSRKVSHSFSEDDHSCVCGHREYKMTLDLQGEGRVLYWNIPGVWRSEVRKNGDSIYLPAGMEFELRADAASSELYPAVSAELSSGMPLEVTASKPTLEDGMVRELFTFKIPEEDGEDFVLHVHFEPRVQVVFSSGEATDIVGEMPLAPLLKNSVFTLPVCAFSSKNWVFKGWEITGSGAEACLYKPGETITVTEDTIVTAVWQNTEAYPLWVNGIQVSAANRGDVLGDGSGSVSYDPESRLLTLNNPAGLAVATGSDAGAAQTPAGIIRAEGIDLTVDGVGFIRTQTGQGCGIVVIGGGLTLRGGLSIGGSPYGVYCDKALRFEAVDRETEVSIQGSQAVKARGGVTQAYDLVLSLPENSRRGSDTILTAEGTPADWVKVVSGIRLYFECGEGSGSMPTALIAYGRSYPLPACSFTAPEGRRFKAWSVNGTEYAPGSELTLTEDSDACAVWEMDPDQHTHSYMIESWSWSFEGESASAAAQFVCPVCGDRPEPVPASVSESVTAPLCDRDGRKVYTASVDFEGKRCSDTRTKTLPSAGHIPGEAVRENEKAAGCTDAGSYQEVTYCSTCHAVLGKTEKTTPALGHDWSGWTPGEQRMERSCTRCGAIEQKADAACEHSLIWETGLPAGCTAFGVKEHYRCTVCMGLFSDIAGKRELSGDDVLIPASGHRPGEPTRINEKAPTCTAPGSYDEQISCTVCGKPLETVARVGEPAHGHRYILSGWSWDGYYAAAALFRCTVCGDEQSFEAAVTDGMRTEPACTMEGSRIHQAVVSFEGKNYTDSRSEALAASGHTAGSPEHENTVEATCTHAGGYDEVIRCTRCGKELERSHVTVPALGHEWGSWTPGEEAPQRVCGRCGTIETKAEEGCTHELIFEALIPASCTEGGVREHYRCTKCMGLYSDSDALTELTGDDVLIPAPGHTPGEPVEISRKAPDCTTAGSSVETVSCTVCGALLKRENKELGAPLGHDYALTGWEWSDDGTYAAARFTCRRDPTHTLRSAAELSELRIEPTCTAEGIIKRTARVTFGGETYTDSREERIPPTGHIAGQPVVRNETAATCLKGGSYTEVTYCVKCRTVLENTHISVPALGHDWSEWNPDGEAPRRVCGRCGAVETKAAEECAHEMIFEAAIPASCTEGGVAEHYRCIKCMGLFPDMEGGTELSGDDVLIPALGHTPGEPTRINENVPTCTNPGSYEEVVYCSACGELLHRERKQAEPAHGHAYVLTVWQWADNSESSAVFTCRHDPSHRVVLQAIVTQSRAEPSCVLDGYTLSNAQLSFEGQLYEDQKIRVIPAFGHEAGAAVREKIVSASCTSEGSYEETVRCVYCGEELQSTKTVTPALGHDWQEQEIEGELFMVCTRCDLQYEKVHTHQCVLVPARAASCTEQGYSRDFYLCTVCMELFRDAQGTQAETLDELILPALGHQEGRATISRVIDATCEEDGSHNCETRCTRCGELLRQEKRTAAPALGHDYVLTGWEWTQDTIPSVRAVFTCTRDDSHVHSERAQLAIVRVEPSCFSEGCIRITAAARFNGELYAESREEPIPALTHSRSLPYADNEIAATCLEDGSYEEKIICTRCGEILARTEKAIRALGHDWFAPSYFWTEDNSTVTASHVCSRDMSHTESETVSAAWALILSPTDTDEGRTGFRSAPFENPAFTVQIKDDRDIPALNTLSGLRLPEMLTSIEEEAFRYGAFQYVIIPPTCTSIGNDAFADCTALLYILIPASVTAIAEDAFEGCRDDLIVDRRN